MELIAVGRLVACAALVATSCGAAPAQTASPSPSPSATADTMPSAPAATATPSVAVPAGFTGRAHAQLIVTTASRTFSGNLQLGVAQRDALTRIDVLSLSSDAFPLPPMTGTVVVDHRAHTVTAWSDTTKAYYTQRLDMPRVFTHPSPGPSRSPSPRASARPRATAPARTGSPLRNLDVFAMTLKLLGHTTTNGVPTTGLAFDLQVAKHGDRATSHVTASTQLADEYAFFPMTLDASLEPGTTPFSAKLAYAVDSLTRGLPPASEFTVPAGYRRVTSPMAVFMPGGSRSVQPTRRVPVPPPTPSPGPSPSP